VVGAGDGTSTWEDVGDLSHGVALDKLAKAASATPAASTAASTATEAASTPAEAATEARPTAPASAASSAPASTGERLPGGVKEIEERTGGRLQRPAGAVTEVL